MHLCRASGDGGYGLSHSNFDTDLLFQTTTVNTVTDKKVILCGIQAGSTVFTLGETRRHQHDDIEQ
jgi:hypothetical protein